MSRVPWDIMVIILEFCDFSMIKTASLVNRDLREYSYKRLFGSILIQESIHKSPEQTRDDVVAALEFISRDSVALLVQRLTIAIEEHIIGQLYTLPTWLVDALCQLDNLDHFTFYYRTLRTPEPLGRALSLAKFSPNLQSFETNLSIRHFLPSFWKHHLDLRALVLTSSVFDATPLPLPRLRKVSIPDSYNLVIFSESPIQEMTIYSIIDPSVPHTPMPSVEHLDLDVRNLMFEGDTVGNFALVIQAVPCLRRLVFATASLSIESFGAAGLAAIHALQRLECISWQSRQPAPSSEDIDRWLGSCPALYTFELLDTNQPLSLARDHVMTTYKRNEIGGPWNVI